MIKLLVHGLSIESTEKIRRKLDLHLGECEVITSTDMDKTKDISAEKAINLLIYESENFGKRDFNLLKDFRVWGLGFPILVISNNIVSIDLDSKKNDARIHFVESNFEDKKLVGITKKLMRTKQIPQQGHKRYHTNQRVLLETISQGVTLDSSMYNLSKGGAYCEFDPEEQLKLVIGDIVKLSVPLNEMEKRHALSAKVVWTTPKGRYSGRNGIGLKFVNADDLYRQLLGKLV